jgi:hypothetical protein
MKMAAVFAGLLACTSMLTVAATEATARSKCERGAHVRFNYEVDLTRNDVIVCTAFKNQDGTAQRLGAHKVSCLIEYWGICSGRDDAGWAPLNSFRRLKK